MGRQLVHPKAFEADEENQEERKVEISAFKKIYSICYVYKTSCEIVRE